MRIVFAGTPEFAVPSLERLIRDNYQIVAVYTQPDRLSGRGRSLTISPVKRAALGWNIPVIQPDSLKDTEAASQLASFKPDVMVVAAFGQILHQSVIDIPVHGCINIHPSLSLYSTRCQLRIPSGAQTIAMFYIMMLFVPLWFAGLMISFPNNPIWVVLSIFPFTAPIQIMLRLGVSDVPTWQILTSIAVLGLSVIAGLSFSIKIFRTFMIMYGKRPSLAEMIRGLKTD